jgi:Tfp pilus assembly protein PilZ
MGTAQERVHARYRVDLTVTLRWRRTVETVHAWNVSEGGLFLVTRDQPPLRELVRLEIPLPGRAEPLEVHGMAVNTATECDPDGRPPGVGVQFYALDREAQRLIGQYIDQVRLAAPALSALPPPEVSLELEIASDDDLYEFYMRDVAAGGMFIVSDVALAVGEGLSLIVRHPIVDDCFVIGAVVRAASEGPDGPGLTVEFVGLDAERLDALREFIDGPIESEAPPPLSVRPTQREWQDPFAQQPREKRSLAQLFDPWTGAAQEQPRTRAQPRDELDMMFDAIAPANQSAVRPSMPSPANEDVPDFLMAIPSWSKLTAGGDPSRGVVAIDLEPDDIIEVPDAVVLPGARAAAGRTLSRAR